MLKGPEMFVCSILYTLVLLRIAQYSYAKADASAPHGQAPEWFVCEAARR